MYIDKQFNNEQLFKVELSTGLYDINGKEIYEGDTTTLGPVEYNFTCWTVGGQPMEPYNNYYEIIDKEKTQ